MLVGVATRGGQMGHYYTALSAVKGSNTVMAEVVCCLSHGAVG